VGSLDLYRAHPHLSATLQPASSLGTNLTRGDSRLSRDRSHAKKRYAALSGEVFSRERARFTPRAERSSWSCVYYIETGAHARTLTRLRSHSQLETRRSHTDFPITRLARHRVVHFCTTRVTIAIIASHSISTASENMWQAAPL